MCVGVITASVPVLNDLLRRRRKGLYSPPLSPPPNSPCLTHQATRSSAGYTTTCSGEHERVVWHCKINRSSTNIKRRSWNSRIVELANLVRTRSEAIKVLYTKLVQAKKTIAELKAEVTVPLTVGGGELFFTVTE